MKKRLFGGAVALGVAVFAPGDGFSQTNDIEAAEDAAPSATDQGEVPPVEVIQPQPEVEPTPAPAPAVEPQPRPRPRPAPAIYTPPPPPPPAPVVTAPAERGADGLAIDPAPALGPNNPTSILPHDLDDYAGAGTRITTQQIDEDRPLTTQEELSRVPGVSFVADDGWGRHINLSVRGSPPRRTRKVLMMEDGQSINLATYIDPSMHYTPPIDRIESIEVIRGGTVAYGPLNNHGVVNFRNLSPFGAPETVVSTSFGNENSNYRHAHTRQHAENFGIVFSYSGFGADGVFDLERLTYNDFYGAVGWKGANQDFTLSGLYFRQRDHYDERNLTLPAFKAHPRCKKDHCMLDEDGNLDLGLMGNRFNTFNADLFMGQAVHNYYFNVDTILSTQAYFYDHERARFESRRGGPHLSEFARDEFPDAPNGNMRGRDRQYRHFGIGTHLELANRPFVAGLRQDIQMGIRAEYQDFRNCNSAGRRGEVLDWENQGNCYAFRGEPLDNPFQDFGRLEEYDAMNYAGFIQSAIHLNDALTLVPGLRFETWDLERRTLFGVNDDDDVIPGLPLSEKKNYDEVLPALAFSWGVGRISEPADWGSKSLGAPPARPRFHTTFYGGYHRGLGIPVARGEQIADLEPEIGDNYQIGLRSSAIKGITLDAALFHSRIDDYQIKDAAVDPVTGNNIFGAVDRVEIDGFEIYSRLDTYAYWQPRLFGHGTNFFGEGTFTYADSVIAKGVDLDEDGTVIGILDGNLVPEVPREFANLTAGIELGSRFNASVTWTYRGSFFTDAVNTVNIVPEGDAGKVDSVWLLSARANYTIPNTQYTLFVTGNNLEDKLYIADLSDGIKPGMGRTIMGGVKLKWGGSGPRD